MKNIESKIIENKENILMSINDEMLKVDLY